MDSLKLDRFRRLLNRQNTNVNLCETHTATTTSTSQANSADTTASSQPQHGSEPTSSATENISTIDTKQIKSTDNIENAAYSINDTLTLASNLPDYITSDDPKPAVFIARKLFCDFVEIVSKKIDVITRSYDASKEMRQPHLFKLLQKEEDPIYHQILEGFGSISEYCLPSLVSSLLAWHNHQLETEEQVNFLASKDSIGSKQQSSRPQSSLGTIIGSIQHQSQQLQQNDSNQESVTLENQDAQPQPDCTNSPPCNSSEPISFTMTSASNNSSSLLHMRSPTPSLRDTSINQISLSSPTPLDFQSPSIPVVLPNSPDLHQQPSSVNTSTSTATNTSSGSIVSDDSTSAARRLKLVKAQRLLVKYASCQALIEIFSKLYLHPGHEDLISQIENIAFEHFKVDTQGSHNGDSGDVIKLSDKYAEIIGVLAQTRFALVRKRFLAELNEWRTKELSPYNIQSIVTLLQNMKYIRVKMAPIEDFEASFQLLQECADYFIEVRHKSIRHALADLFVEIMLPLSSIVKNEVKIPCLKNFVDTLWTASLDMCARKKHSSTMFPLVTCLLCLSQRSIFLQNWTSFLNMCLSNLKNRDTKICRIALESLYRLIWIYVIRAKCESNNVTHSRLQNIVDALFPRGSRQVVPRETPLAIYVDIILFIAQERLDFAMRHIIFELLSVDRPNKIITAPERMNIAIQAFLVVADHLQKKDQEIPMPKTVGFAYIVDFRNLNTGIRKPGSHKIMLNDETLKTIGLHPYYSHIQKSFSDILKTLDSQFGRPYLLTTCLNKDDLLASDRKSKFELFKTCIAALPRLMPDGIPKTELIDLLSRLTVHVDEEMRRLAFESLQLLVTDFQDWRMDAIEGYTVFLANQIDETLRNLVDAALRVLLQLLVSWRTVVTSAAHTGESSYSSKSSTICIQTGYETISTRNTGSGGQIVARKNRALANMRLIQSELSNTRFDRLVNVLQKVEGASLVMLCSCHKSTRKIAGHILRESRAILKCYSSWTCMDQFGMKSPDELENDDDGTSSLRGSLSADNLSKITTLGMSCPAHNSVTSMNTQSTLATSVSKLCISAPSCQRPNSGTSSNNNANIDNAHDLYDEDIENNLADCYSSANQSTTLFWIAVMMLESNRENEYVFALRLLRKILPSLPVEQQDFHEEIDRDLQHMNWDTFTGIHSLVLKGCASGTTYDLCISLLDQVTPILNQRICNANESTQENCLPFHVLILATQLLSTYEYPTPSSLDIARRLALCCEESSLRLENLSAVMMLYSRRSFSKDAFQWIKCVAKYLHDAYPHALPVVLPLLVDILERGPCHVQHLIAPILYCLLTYTNLDALQSNVMIANLFRIYTRCLGTAALWRDALQLFKLIISKASHLADGTRNSAATRELPGRTMSFSVEIESLPVIAKFNCAPSELGACGVGTSLSRNKTTTEAAAARQQ